MSNETAVTVRDSGALTAKEVRAQVNLIQEVMQAVMKPDVHYGRIPGAGDKPTLLKAGAEKILSTFRIGVNHSVEDLSTGDEARYRVTANAFSAATGTPLGCGMGEASSCEEKYKWRRAVCDPEFDQTPEDRKRIAFKKYEGKVHEVKQVRTNHQDVANTILKMAVKRALVAVCLQVTAASDVFAQDLEDADTVEAERQPIQEPKAKAAQEPAPAPANDAAPDGERVTLVVGKVRKQSSPPESEKEWTRFYFRVGDDWYSTFDANVGSALEAASGTEKTLMVKRGPKGCDVLAIEEA